MVKYILENKSYIKCCKILLADGNMTELSVFDNEKNTAIVTRIATIINNKQIIKLLKEHDWWNEDPNIQIKELDSKYYNHVTKLYPSFINQIKYIDHINKKAILNLTEKVVIDI